MIKDLNNLEFSQKMQGCGKYIEALEEERRKIQVFQRELPLCLELVTQAIEACRRELSGPTEYVYGQSECSEQTTGECGPVFEEFIPIKRTSYSEEEEEEEDDDDNEQESHEPDDKITKSDWLRSVQLWNQSPDPPTKEPEKETIVEVKKNNGEFQPYNHHAEKSASGESDGDENRKSPVKNAAEGHGGRKKETEKDGGQRKQRRCWSQELHLRFLNALQQLGGPRVATPKQIRELMKVDGLTNDEVKSHLQKHRLHTRRPSQTVSSTAGNAHTPHLVVVRSIWVPQPDYPMADTATATNSAATIYGAAMAAPPPTALPPPPQWPSQTKFEPLIPEERSRCADGVRYNSPATSSSARNGKKC